MILEEKKRTRFQKGKAAAARAGAKNYQRQANTNFGERALRHHRQAARSFRESVTKLIQDAKAEPSRGAS
jgi:hypothetical protein